MIPFEDKMRAGGSAALQHVEDFFSGSDPVHGTLRRIVKKLDDLGVIYAVAGSFAMGAHGVKRATIDVDILVSDKGCRSVHEHLDGRGYAPIAPGSRHLRDTKTGVRVKFLITGEFPGDGQPKPVAFPDPAGVAIDINGIPYLRLENLIELKLASGLNNPNRLRGIANAQELIRALRPPRTLGDSLHEFVRGRFYELWDGLQNERPER